MKYYVRLVFQRSRINHIYVGVSNINETKAGYKRELTILSLAGIYDLVGKTNKVVNSLSYKTNFSCKMSHTKMFQGKNSSSGEHTKHVV